MVVNGDEKPLVELEGAGELLHQLPHTLQKLIDDRRHLLWVSNQVITPRNYIIGSNTAGLKLTMRDKCSQTCEKTCGQMRSSLSQ